MLIKTVLFITFVTTNTLAEGYYNFEAPRVHPDTGLNVKQLIEKYGFPFENHTLQTEDGYILEMHRIPYGRRNTGNSNRPPVLLVHGLLSSSADFVNTGVEKSLGFILAEKGYDVWLANCRGTRWSRKHATLNPDKDKNDYWNFSFQHMGHYDLSASIDYILALTNQEKLFYIGHSQGTTSFLALASSRPEYNDKIRLSIALAPVAYSTHRKSPIVYFLDIFQEQIEALVNKYQLFEVLPYNPFVSALGGFFCHDKSPVQDICAAMFYIAAGYTPNQFNKTIMTVVVSNAPAGASFRQFQHHLQMLQSKNFCQYDYGEKANMEIYGQPSPPCYELNKITAPVAFYYGDKDIFISKEDIDRTASELPNLVVNKCIEGFSHIDIVWGIDVVKLVFNNIVEIMGQY